MAYKKEFAASKLRQWEKYLRDYTLPTWEQLPSIDLYMDQVIALLDQYLTFLPQDEGGDEIVTASAINNYVRTKIMPAPVKKRYSRIHIAYLIMICTLKQSLSIAYVQKIIPMGLTEAQVKEIYRDYVERHKAASMYVISQVRSIASPVLDMDDPCENPVENLIFSTAVVAGLARLLTEKLLHLEEPSPAAPERPAKSSGRARESKKSEDAAT